MDNNNWISVEDRKPPNVFQRVLVTNGYGFMAVGVWDDDFEYWFVEGEKWVKKPSGPITHWMPLPSPPTKH